MRFKSFIVTLLSIIGVLFLLTAVLFIKSSPGEITLKDLNSSVNHNQYKQISQESELFEQKTGKNFDYEKEFEYYIVLGSFKNVEQAKKAAGGIKKQTSRDIIIMEPTPEGLIRISYGKYYSRDEAESVNKKVREEINPNAWILTVKK